MDPLTRLALASMLFWLIAWAITLLGITALVRKLIGRPFTWFGLDRWLMILLVLFIGAIQQLVVIGGIIEALIKVTAA